MLNHPFKENFFIKCFCRAYKKISTLKVQIGEKLYVLRKSSDEIRLELAFKTERILFNRFIRILKILRVLEEEVDKVNDNEILDIKEIKYKTKKAIK